MTNDRSVPGAPRPCTVDSTDSGDWWCLVTVQGDVDIESAPWLSDAFDDALSRGRRHIALDMGSVTFIDSTGLSAILRGRRDAVAAGGSLRLTDASRTVLLVLDITNLTDELIERRGKGDAGRDTPRAR